MAKKICIAPGHGGFDPGAVGSYNGATVYEKDINLRFSLMLRDRLVAAGVPVVMTRERDWAAGDAKDKNSDLRNQCTLANASGADLFFSPHVNAGGGAGGEMWVFHDGGNVAKLAADIIKATAPIIGVHGAPVKDGSGYYVINNTAMPAMIYEMGFIDTYDIQILLMRLDALADAVAKVLIYWAGGETAKPPDYATQLAQAVSDKFVREGKPALDVSKWAGRIREDIDIQYLFERIR